MNINNFDEPNLISNLGEFFSTQSQFPPSPHAASDSAKQKGKGLKTLPPDFVPTNYSVILGRGKGSYNHVGNKRCRVIVKSFLREFYAHDTRSDRAVVVSKVIAIIKEANPEGGAFCKFDSKSGLWYEASDRVTREKIFTMFRDVQNAESREALRASSTSPENMSRSTFAAAKASSGSTKGASLPPLRRSLLVGSFPQSNPFQSFALSDNDEGSLGESFSESLGSRNFYDVDSCSLCTI